MPVVVEVLDKQFSALKKSVLKQAQWLVGKEEYVEIYLVGDDFMYKNVLSFPHPQGFPRPDIKQQVLGEIYLNPSYIKEHGEDLVFMLVHGFLHLLGYDHIKKSDRIVMERKEKKLLADYKNMYAISGRTRHRISGH